MVDSDYLEPGFARGVVVCIVVLYMIVIPFSSGRGRTSWAFLRGVSRGTSPAAWATVMRAVQYPVLGAFTLVTAASGRGSRYIGPNGRRGIVSYCNWCKAIPFGIYRLWLLVNMTRLARMNGARIGKELECRCAELGSVEFA